MQEIFIFTANLKAMSFHVKNIDSKEEMEQQFPLIKQLTKELNFEDYARMLEEMLAGGYNMAGIFDGEKCVGVSGYWINTKIYSDKYLEMDNVVIDENYRSHGLGKMLSDFLLKVAQENNCKTIMLDAYLENESAHKFYLREGFIKRGYHFIKKI